jgi:hypothetical protein
MARGILPLAQIIPNLGKESYYQHRMPSKRAAEMQHLGAKSHYIYT